MSASDKNREISTLTIEDSEVSTQTNTTGEFSAIVDVQIPNGMRYEFPRGMPLEFFVYTHESASVSANSTDTVNLSNNLVNSPSLADIPTASAESGVSGPYSLVVWDDNDDIQTGVDSVDYTANTFDYTNSDGSQDNLEVWYLWGDSSQTEFRVYDETEESYSKENVTTQRQFHKAETFSKPSYITFSDDFVMTEKQHLKLSVKTDVDLTNWDVLGPNPSSSPGSFDTYGYSDFSIPVRKTHMRR